MTYEIKCSEPPNIYDVDALQQGYEKFTEAQIGVEDRRDIAFFVRDSQGHVIGGVKGSYGNYGWLWIDLLWVAEAIRNKGYGTRLMTLIEEHAKNNGCTNVHLNSFSFQGVEFYKKIGYREYGRLDDFPSGHSVCSLTKKLVN